MTKQEQIEGMAKIICKHNYDCICLIDKTSCDGRCVWQEAEALYNAGYRKGDEEVLYRDGTTVILSGERYYKLHEIEQKGVIEAYHVREEARRETAQEFAKKLSTLFNEFTMESTFTVREILGEIYGALKEYGVEVEE